MSRFTLKIRKLDHLDDHAQETGNSLVKDLSEGIRCYVDDIVRAVDYDVPGDEENEE